MLEYTTLQSTQSLPQPELHGLTDWARLDRFLIFGCESGSYHATERELAIGDAGAAARCIAADGLRFVSRIVAISESGRAPKNDPAIFSLAMASKLGDEATRRAAYAALPAVCRIGTDLMQFARHAQSFGGWGRGMRKAVGTWFNALPPTELAYQLAKYKTRDGWSNRDLLRLAHPRAASPSHDRLFAWAVKGQLPEGATEDPALGLIVAVQELATITKHTPANLTMAADLIRRHRVPRECVPTPLLRHAEIWDALLDAMPMSALIRNLATMTRVGLLAVNSAATEDVVARLAEPSSVHPIAFLAARVSYESGRSRADGAWIPVVDIVDALDAAFYASFRTVAPANKRTLIALDISSSMASGTIAGVAGLTPRLASAAMALVTSATEPACAVVAFTTAADGYGGKWGGGMSKMTPLSKSRRLDDTVAEVGALPFGGTDCALPMIWAKENKVDVDTFVVYTDGETWAGDVHPVRALRDYRDARGIPAKLVVVGMTSNGFSIADPNDTGMLDVVGFDTSTPPVLSDFARG